ncbi:MAG: hypothetical protein KQJ78_10495 [Deltaproteobacteria bacterium]|nr:hypothetical protein [Deltaproteobacteria bacterium]
MIDEASYQEYLGALLRGDRPAAALAPPLGAAQEEFSRLQEARAGEVSRPPASREAAPLSRWLPSPRPAFAALSDADLSGR